MFLFDWAGDDHALKFMTANQRFKNETIIFGVHPFYCWMAVVLYRIWAVIGNWSLDGCKMAFEFVSADFIICW